MANPAAGFWSYVRADDDAVEGQIVDLARRIIAHYEMLTASKLELFIDRESLVWGDEWSKRIEDAIAGTTFFIPIITPRYFESEACRRELVNFTGKARSSGLEELLLPVYWVNVPELSDDAPEDEAMRLIKATQWEDWRDHRLADPQDSVVRRAVQSMAERLAAISESVARVPDTPAAAEPEAMESEEPGLLDQLALGEEALPRMNDVIEEIGNELHIVAATAEAATHDMEAADARGGGFAPRVIVIRNLARELDPHAQRIEELGRQYGTALVDTDPAVQILLRQIEEAVLGEAEPLGERETREAAEFVENVEQMGTVAEEALGELRSLLSVLEEAAALSRDIRRPTGQMRRGLQGIIDGQAVIDAWARKAAELRILLREDGEDEAGMAVT